MLFNSVEYIFFFLPISFFIYFFLLNKRLIVAAKGFLVFASLLFYSWWNIVYLPLILSSMLFNYVVGNTLNGNFNSNKIHKKTILIIGIIFNLSLLGYFKYMDFFILNFNWLTDSSISLLNLALPLAISFFTFQQIAYLVDSYRAETQEYDFLNYALFVTFFPQLIAGPIVHHAEMMPQFASRWNLVKNYYNIALGLFIFSVGLFKKVVVADTFAVWATQGFDVSVTLSFIEAWVTSLSYTFQLYFDFSGYTDMAIGSALLFNIKLPINFNSPYKALNIQDFWRRWHITLSRFLKDYIYIPLGGNRNGSFRTYTNLLATFVLGGIWHGAGWTFIFWGFLHGMALVIHRFWTRFNISMPKILTWFITFNFINIAWIFFRAKEWDDAQKVLLGMLNVSSIDTQVNIMENIYKITIMDFINIQDTTPTSIATFCFITLLFLVALFGKNTIELKEYFLKYPKTTAFMGAVAFTFAIYNLNNASEFLYFNF